jgi:hypothetical protein
MQGPMTTDGDISVSLVSARRVRRGPRCRRPVISVLSVRIKKQQRDVGLQWATQSPQFTRTI